ERNNKGYFAIKSFLSDRFYARTYHHSHTENPHGSIFMALRNVLIDADIIER
ncbi:MAG: hypothetical protein K0R76_869, partial [Alphaproteobacteria bacterium]|nr:hypothetical protein [Alphaproteobacteria bacterium]